MSDVVPQYLSAVRERNALKAAARRAWKAGDHQAFVDLHDRFIAASEAADKLGMRFDRWLSRQKALPIDVPTEARAGR